MEITEYQLGWNERQNVGQVRIRLANGQGKQIRVNSLADLAGWATLLNEKPVFVSPNGWVHTGPEPTGE